jgi:hypothetical protein
VALGFEHLTLARQVLLPLEPLHKYFFVMGFLRGSHKLFACSWL